jgi:hypothetical protein
MPEPLDAAGPFAAAAGTAGRSGRLRTRNIQIVFHQVAAAASAVDSAVCGAQ